MRDAAGCLTGMLLERSALSCVTDLLPEPGDGELRQAIRSCIRVYNQAGITTVREPGLVEPEVRAYQAVIPEERSLRTSLMLRVDLGATPDERRRWIEGLGRASDQDGQWLEIWGLKVYLDGGVEGGFFRQPYANNPGFRGYSLTSQKNLEAILEEAQHLSWKVGIHVVGDAALDMALDAFYEVEASSPKGVRGNVLEHAFSPIPGAMDRCLEMGIGVTLQHALVYSLGGNMQSYWGDPRASDCTPSRAWLDSGAVVGIGTDSPVTRYDPWLNVYGFATRDTEVAGVMGPQHRISVAEALRAYTSGSAAILGCEQLVGSLSVGKAADFICLDRNPLSSTPEDVRGMVVQRTYVGGRQVFPST